MLIKRSVLVFHALLLLQVVHGTRELAERQPRGYIEVNGKQYYMDDIGDIRDVALADCQSRNMKLLSFETLQEYSDVEYWLMDNGYEYMWFWSSGVREQDSTDWVWESINQNVQEFNWISGSPDLPGSTRACIVFRPLSLGWDDDDCIEFPLPFICE